jgi:hypothetical protein
MGHGRRHEAPREKRADANMHIQLTHTRPPPIIRAPGMIRLLLLTFLLLCLCALESSTEFFIGFSWRIYAALFRC